MEKPNYVLAAEAKRRQLLLQRFTITWNGGGCESSVPFDRVLAVLGLQPQSVRSLLSRGAGSWQWTRVNPVTGEPDIVTVARLPDPPKPKAKRGRPRTRPLHPRDDDGYLA